MDGKKLLLIILICSTFLAATGQLLFKYAFIDSKMLLLFLGAGFVAYASSTVLYLFVLSRANLSWTYGLGGMSYIFAVVFAAVILKEPVIPLEWIGIVLIFVGTIFVGMS
jgi:uncharacterized membrane protein